MTHPPSTFRMRLRMRLLGPRRFAQFASSPHGGIWGVYDSFEDAKKHAPKTKPFGYDFPELATQYAQQLTSDNWEGSGQLLRTFDYPILFWLSRLAVEIPGPVSLVDLGGNIGVHYFAYQHRMQEISRVRWQVLDLPSIVQEGMRLATKRAATSLTFITDPSEAHESHILFASGSVHYLPSLSALLSALPNKPPHILLNRVPLYDGATYVTLQNGGLSFYPQYVFNRAEFLKTLTQAGYTLRDEWLDHGERVVLPFYPERCIPHCSGLYFSRASER